MLPQTSPYDGSARRLLFVAWGIVVALVIALSVSGCASEAPARGWAGTADTLSSGQVSVYNPLGSLWSTGDEWVLREEVRVGTLDGMGPDMFGAITDFEVDAYGRVWLFEGQAQELRVFDSDGRHIRTVGRQGEGPGEFTQVIGTTWGPDGHLWIVDPSNNRLSVVDTTGAFVASHPTIGGIVIMPWPGGFDDAGRFYTYGVDTAAEDDFALVMVRHGPDLQPIDSVAPPEYPGERQYYEIRNENSWMMTGVPFTPSLEWRLGHDGTYWAGLTGDYRIFQLSWSGDTLRSIRRDYEALPVTSTDLEEAKEGLDWFIEAGGKADWSRIPSSKPAFEDFVIDDAGYLWVQMIAPEDESGRLFDVFDPEGRYLGEVLAPFPVVFNPAPVIEGDHLYAVTEDELEVPFLVRARIERPEGR
jgi:sugar lactone lactonase YvrE